MSLSINTNSAAMVALESLNATTNALNNTENVVSTGQKVSSASDNPAAYAIAASMNGNISGLSAVSDGLSFAAQIVTTTSSATSSIISTLQLIQSAVTSTGNTGVSVSTVQSEVDGYLDQINTMARNATVNGVNLLDGTNDVASATGVSSSTLTNTMQYVTGLQGAANTVTSVTSSGALTDSLGLTSSTTLGGSVSSLASNLSALFSSSTTPTATVLQSAIQAVQSAITSMTSKSDVFAAASQTISGMTTYSSNLSDSLTSGVGALTDADMAEESAKLTSLQTKQSLAISSLSVAKSSSQNILSLFR
ncbi:flagellin N-terminal helical domain-containing protein [Acetobacter conturbans]|uniref:Flagellin n=1 Tax=Acetobacter conturbans TaxID=1737472 RepID=A0ABX0JYS0_9PROT|nr:flagellin [Acetobacter conturbans]NHN88481.1 flagellin C [Acetobacter conturbans]